MVEDTHDGEFLAPPPTRQRRAPERRPGRVGPFNYTLSEQSVRVREAADAGDPQRSSSATASAAS